MKTATQIMAIIGVILFGTLMAISLYYVYSGDSAMATLYCCYGIMVAVTRVK